MILSSRPEGGICPSELSIFPAQTSCDVRDQLKAIPERIQNMTPACARDFEVLFEGNVGRFQSGSENIVIFADQSRVRFQSRAKLLFHSQMNLNRTTTKPAASALGEFGRLWNFGHPTEIGEKTPCGVLPACGHGELNVCNGKKRRTTHAEIERTRP